MIKGLNDDVYSEQKQSTENNWKSYNVCYRPLIVLGFFFTFNDVINILFELMDIRYFFEKLILKIPLNNNENLIYIIIPFMNGSVTNYEQTQSNKFLDTIFQNIQVGISSINFLNPYPFFIFKIQW